MPQDTSWPTRQNPRLPEYDYAQQGGYFVTICTHERCCTLASVADGQVRLTRQGEIAADCWNGMPKHYPFVQLDAFVIMPNHVHGVLFFNGDLETAGTGRARHASPLQTPDAMEGLERSGFPISASLSTVVGSFKSAVSRLASGLSVVSGAPVWQRGFYEHVIRAEEPLNRIRNYVLSNPARWASDPDNPQSDGRRNGDPWSEALAFSNEGS
jgi:REP element-mobilizing transposase RayT